MQAEKRAEAKGQAFNQKQATNWFHKKDANNDGVLEDSGRAGSSGK